MPSILQEIEAVLEPHGLILRGGFAPGDQDGAPEGTGAVVLIGNAGPALWRAFAPHADEAPDALDHWVGQVIGDVAGRFGARPLYPCEGPPYWPFQRWAMRAEPVHPSPLGILIHPEYGLWHAYRAALAFADPIELPPRPDLPSPCGACPDRPCLAACPVEAFTPARYDVRLCRAHLSSAAGADCLSSACRARRACPLGHGYRYATAQARFHMSAFLAGQR